MGNYPDLCEHSPSTPLESWECVHCFGYRPVTPPGSEKTRHTIQTNRILSRNRGTGYFQINHHLKQTHPSKNDDLKSRKFSRCIENKNAGTQPRIVHTFIVQWAHRICPTPKESTALHYPMIAIPRPRFIHSFIVQWVHRICPTPEESTALHHPMRAIPRPRFIHSFIVQWAHCICPTPEGSTALHHPMRAIPRLRRDHTCIAQLVCCICPTPEGS